MKHGMYISGEIWEPMLGYSWALTFSLYHPCILLPGLTHAWSIGILTVCIFEYIIEVQSTPSPTKVMSGYGMVLSATKDHDTPPPLLG